MWISHGDPNRADNLSLMLTRATGAGAKLSGQGLDIDGFGALTFFG